MATKTASTKSSKKAAPAKAVTAKATATKTPAKASTAGAVTAKAPVAPKPTAKAPTTKAPVASRVENKTPTESKKRDMKTEKLKDTKAPAKAAAKKSSATATGAKSMRPDLDLEHFRDLLLAERARLETERDQIRNRGGDMDGALPEDGEGGDEDTADLASAMMDKEYDLSVEDEIEQMLQSVDHALQKIEDGSYGICDMSGDPIPVGRLELLPWATLTVECQALAEGE